MKNNYTLKLLSYKDYTVCTIEKDNELWFMAKDIYLILYLDNFKKFTNVMNSLDDDEKDTFYVDNDTQKMSHHIINEFGLYSLVFNSHNKKEAKEFLRWVRRVFSLHSTKIGIRNIVTQRFLTALKKKAYRLFFPI